MKPALYATGGLLLIFSLGLAPRVYADRLDGVAAVVGDDVILISEVETRAEPIIFELRRREQGRLPGGAVREAMEQTLQVLIDERLILEVARRMQIETTEEDVDHTVETVAREENLTPDRVYALAQEQGMTRERYREQMKTEITKAKVIRNVVSARVSVSEDEVRALFDERYGDIEPGIRVRSRHILIPWPDKGGEPMRQKARALMEKVRQEALGNADFATLARAYSAAPSAGNGGLTEFREGEVASALAGFIFGAAPNAISPVIETDHGLNLLQVLDRFDPTKIEFEDLAPQLRAELSEGKSRPEYEKWIADLRKNEYVEVIAQELR